MSRTPYQRKRELERRRKVAAALAGMDAMHGKTEQARAGGVTKLLALGGTKKKGRG